MVVLLQNGVQFVCPLTAVKCDPWCRFGRKT